MVFQHFKPIPHLTVLGKYHFSSKRIKKSKKKQKLKPHALELLEQLGLSEKVLISKTPYQGGQKQTVLLLLEALAMPTWYYVMMNQPVLSRSWDGRRCIRSYGNF